MGFEFHTFHTLALAKHLSSLRPVALGGESRSNWQTEMELSLLGGGGARLGGVGLARVRGVGLARSSSNLLLTLLLLLQLAANLPKAAIAAVPANASIR